MTSNDDKRRPRHSAGKDQIGQRVETKVDNCAGRCRRIRTRDQGGPAGTAWNDQALPQEEEEREMWHEAGTRDRDFTTSM